MTATIIPIRGYYRSRPGQRCRIDDDKHTELRVELALTEWERTFASEALRDIAREDPAQAQRIMETW